MLQNFKVKGVVSFQIFSFYLETAVALKACFKFKFCMIFDGGLQRRFFSRLRGQL